MHHQVPNESDERKYDTEKGEPTRVLLHRSTLLEHLGVVAVAVLDMLLCGPGKMPLVDRHGITTITNAGGRGRAVGSAGLLRLLRDHGLPGLTLRRLTYAVEKLKATGLLVTLGHTEPGRRRHRSVLVLEEVDVLSGEPRTVRVDLRRVTAKRQGFGYLVTIQSARLVREKTTRRGGKRPGAGRKAARCDCCGRAPGGVRALVFMERSIRVCRGCASRATRAEIKLGRERSSSRELGSDGLLSFGKKTRPAGAVPSGEMPSTSPPRQEGVYLLATDLAPRYPCVDLMFPNVERDTARRRERAREVDRLTYLPRPPHLDPDLDDAGRVRWLLTAYRGANGARFVGARGLSGRVTATMLAGALALTAQGIAPASWAAYSVDRWCYCGEVEAAAAAAEGRAPRRKRPARPPLAWTWSARRMTDEGEAFATWLADTKFQGLRSCWTLARRRRLRAALKVYDLGQRAACDPSTTPGRLAGIRLAFEIILHSCRRQASADAEALERLAKDGAYLW